MGNTVSGSRDRSQDDTVDFGTLTPQGIYTGPQDWNQQVVENLIVDRKLAPFYRPLEDYDSSWDDDQILAARKELPNSPQSAHSESSQGTGGPKSHHGKNPNKNGKEPFRLSESSVYKGAIECPICFLYYPPNINRSRCCDQAICTECFVQIKRAEPTTTHLVSEPAACPYCVQENFGVTYQPPDWKAGLAREGHVSPPSPIRSESKAAPPGSDQPKRRKSFGANDPEVVTIDHIRPDWEAKLAAVRAVVQRRANRRIIMRQVGDRLIPVGITSGRIVNIEPSGEGGDAENNNGSPRRRRRHQHSADLNQLMGPDLEELMIMEAMRLSLIEHEEQQRRQSAPNNTTNTNANVNLGANANTIAGTNADTNAVDIRSQSHLNNQNVASASVMPSSSNSSNNRSSPSSTSSPNASPRNSLSPPNELSGTGTTSPSPRQSFMRIPSPLGGGSSELSSGVRRSTSSSNRSSIIAALTAHTASAILGNDGPDQTRRTESDRLTDTPPTTTIALAPASTNAQSNSDANTLENAIADATNHSLNATPSSNPEVRFDGPSTTFPSFSPSSLSLPSPPSPPPPPSHFTADSTESSLAYHHRKDDLPAIPSLPERTMSPDDLAAEHEPEGYVPLASTADLSDPLIKH